MSGKLIIILLFATVLDSMKSIQYYNIHSKAFYERTIHADLEGIYNKFLAHIRPSSKILDAGCGVGRDSKFFLSKGFTVQAFDGSEKMVRLASKELDQAVLHMTFQNISFKEEFDAIWACCSLLHVPYKELRKVMKKLKDALKTNGLFYASFKYGNSLRRIDGREFFDHNEQSIQPYLKELFDLIEIWESADIRIQAASPRKPWLNILCKAL